MKKNVVVITKEFEGEKWETLLDEVYKKKSKDVHIDGFRKGSVPKDIYMKKVGIESLYMDAVDKAINEAYNDIINEGKTIPVVEPKVDIKSIDAKKLVLELTIITAPEVKLNCAFCGKRC